MASLVVKKPFDKFPIEFDFANVLDTDEEIVSYTVGCINTKTNADSKASIVSEDSLASPKVIVVIKDGIAGEKHKITVTAITNFDNELDINGYVDVVTKTEGSFSKTASEQHTVIFDFSRSLKDGDSVTGKTVTATKVSDNTDATADIVEGSLLVSPIVEVGYMAGAKGESYKITVQATTAAGYKYQSDAIMVVR